MGNSVVRLARTVTLIKIKLNDKFFKAQLERFIFIFIFTAKNKSKQTLSCFLRISEAEQYETNDNMKICYKVMILG